MTNLCVVLFFQNVCLNYFFKYNFGEVPMHTSTEIPTHCEPPGVCCCRRDTAHLWSILAKAGRGKGKKIEPEYNQTSRANIHSQESWRRAEGATWHHKGANRHMWSGDILQDTWPGFYKSWQGVGERTVQTKRDLRHIANKCNVCALFESISEQTNSSWFGAIWGNSIIGWILGATRELLLIVFGIVMALW